MTDTGLDIPGVLFTFQKVREEEGYRRISAIKPEILYRWEQRKTDKGVLSNILFGRSPDKGSHYLEESAWSGKHDPFFNEAIDEIENLIR